MLQLLHLYFIFSFKIADDRTKKEQYIKRVCAWCGQDIDTVKQRAIPDPIITHGICNSCKANMINQMEFDVQKFLDSMDDPIIIVDSDAIVLAGNSKAEQILGKSSAKLIGLSLGETFHCENVFDKTLCGQSENCPTCELRAQIVATHASGSGQRNKPVLIKVKEESSTYSLRVGISSEKMGNSILLRIDEINRN